MYRTTEGAVHGRVPHKLDSDRGLLFAAILRRELGRTSQRQDGRVGIVHRAWPQPEGNPCRNSSSSES